jgi:hypothetical protein
MGKTTFAKMLALYLLREHGSLCVVDFDYEYSELPLRTVTPKFKISVPSNAYLGWLITQAAKIDQGGYATSTVFDYLDYFENSENLNDVYIKLKNDTTIPYHIRFAALWRLQVFRKYFELQENSPPDDFSNSRFDLSVIPSIRERLLIQQILVSYIINRAQALKWIIVEETRPGPWVGDIAMEARRKGKRLIFVSQYLPEDLQNYELMIFTPYPARQIPLPVNPLTDRGIWWVGRLGVHRLKHLM